MLVHLIKLAFFSAVWSLFILCAVPDSLAFLFPPLQWYFSSFSSFFLMPFAPLSFALPTRSRKLFLKTLFIVSCFNRFRVSRTCRIWGFLIYPNWFTASRVPSFVVSFWGFSKKRLKILCHFWRALFGILELTEISFHSCVRSFEFLDNFDSLLKQWLRRWLNFDVGRKLFPDVEI